jgi:hypothetical protein
MCRWRGRLRPCQRPAWCDVSKQAERNKRAHPNSTIDTHESAGRCPRLAAAGVVPNHGIIDGQINTA